MTNPVITAFGTNFMAWPSRKAPNRNWMIPVRTVAANRYSSPWSRTSVIMRSAMAPVAAEIMPGRPPTNDVVTAITNEA